MKNVIDRDEFIKIKSPQCYETFDISDEILHTDGYKVCIVFFWVII